MKFCLPFAIGIAIGWNCHVNRLLSFWMIVGLTLSGLIIPIILRRASHSALLFFVLLLFLGIAKITIDTQFKAESDVSGFVNPDRGYGVVGTICDLPGTGHGMVKFGIVAEKILLRDTAIDVSGELQVSIPCDKIHTHVLDSMSFGSHVRIFGLVADPPGRRNPGDFDMKNYFTLNGISARMLADSLDCPNGIAGKEAGFLTSYVYPVRHAASLALDSLIGGAEGNFLKGLLLGERADIPLEVKNEFINAGVMHILAVSGLHVAIVAMILIILFQILRVPEKIGFILTIVALCYYNFLTGSTASVTRSVVMASVHLGGKLLDRKSDIYNSLAVSAILILLVDAKQLFQAGFQLSYAAVLSLVYLYPKVHFLGRLIPQKVRDKTVSKWVVAALSVSLAAGLGTLPFTAYYFGKISVISFIANLIAVPLSNVILAVGMLTLAVWFIVPWLGFIYAQSTLVLTTVFLRLVAAFGNFSLAYIPARFTITSSLLFYVVMTLLFGLENSRLRKYSLVALLFIGMIAIWYPFAFGSGQTLSVTMIDVGEGDSFFLEFPDGKNLLIDCGPKTTLTDAGVRFLQPFLKWKGINHVDGVLLTHPHSDHIGGLPSLLRSITIGNVYDGGGEQQSGIDSEYHRLIDSLHVPLHRMRCGMKFGTGEDCRGYILWPDSDCLQKMERISPNPNNRSVVLKIVYGETSVLFTGDAEAAVERQLTHRYGEFLQSDILKISHHGSITSSSAEFVSVVSPSVALISVGFRNKFHHPSAIVLRRLDERGCRYHRSDEGGAVIMASDGKMWKAVEWK